MKRILQEAIMVEKLIKNDSILPGFDESTVDGLTIRLQKIDSKMLVLYLKGHIDTYNSPGFKSKVNMAIGAGFNNLIFHFGDVTFVSSTGIGAFTAFLKAVKPRGGDLAMLKIQPRIYEVFQLLGFSSFFNIMDNLDDAVKSLTKFESDQSGVVFPKVFRCPICSKNLKASKSGRFRCGECKTILAVDKSANVYLG